MCSTDSSPYVHRAVLHTAHHMCTVLCYRQLTIRALCCATDSSPYVHCAVLQTAHHTCTVLCYRQLTIHVRALRCATDSSSYMYCAVLHTAHHMCTVLCYRQLTIHALCCATDSSRYRHSPYDVVSFLRCPFTSMLSGSEMAFPARSFSQTDVTGTDVERNKRGN